jgi:hypothetical protein
VELITTALRFDEHPVKKWFPMLVKTPAVFSEIRR